MAKFDYDSIKKQYADFEDPLLQIEVEGVDLASSKEPLLVTDADIDMTAGFEASIATIRMHGVYNRQLGSFDISKVKKLLFLGSAIRICAGYGLAKREIFRGFIAKVHFIVPRTTVDEIPSIEITAMDAKAAMMANRHSLKLKATTWSDAVNEVIDKNPFMSTMDFENASEKFVKKMVDNTPDKPEGAGDSPAGGAGGAAGGAGGAGGGESEASDKRMEMVEESDYEFVVKVAKKFNYRFFAVGDTLYFIKQPDANTDALLELTPKSDVRFLDVGYDMTGVVKKVEVRTLDIDQGKFVKDVKTSKAKVSMGSKAKSIVDEQTLVYLDPTADTKEDAGYRAEYLLNETSYRLGSIEAEFIGIPELTPGGLLTLKDFGSPIDNTFYLTRVRHIFNELGYRTEIEGKANTIG